MKLTSPTKTQSLNPTWQLHLFEVISATPYTTLLLFKEKTCSQMVIYFSIFKTTIGNIEACKIHTYVFLNTYVEDRGLSKLRSFN